MKHQPRHAGGPARRLPRRDLTPAEERLAADRNYQQAQAEEYRTRKAERLAAMSPQQAQREAWAEKVSTEQWMRELSATGREAPPLRGPIAHRRPWRYAQASSPAGDDDESEPDLTRPQWVFAADEVYGPGDYVTWHYLGGDVVRVEIRGEIVFDLDGGAA